MALEQIAKILVHQETSVVTPAATLKIATGQPGPPGPAGPAGDSNLAAGSNQWLSLYASTMSVSSMSNIVYNSSDCIVSANIVWPDGATGVLNAVADSVNPDVIASYTMTYVKGLVSKTVSQTFVRDSEGRVTSFPAAVIT